MVDDARQRQSVSQQSETVCALLCLMRVSLTCFPVGQELGDANHTDLISDLDLVTDMLGGDIISGDFSPNTQANLR